MKRTLIALLLIVALILTGCSPAAATQVAIHSGVAVGAPVMKGGGAPAIASDSTGTFGQQTANNSTVPAVAIETRIVIKNAVLSIVVAEPATSQAAIAKMAEDMGGFVVTSNLDKITTQNGIEVPEASITVRVPAARLTEAMNQIKALVNDPKTDILTENVTGQDVTREYTDLQSRLTNLQNAEKQLQKIMEAATKTEDVLAVYNQLVSVREQIEVLKGQIKYYDESSQLSAINVSLKAIESIQPLSIGGWKPVGVARDAVQALFNALKFLANAGIWLVIFCLPIGLLVGLPLFFIIRGFNRLNKRRKTEKKETQEIT